MDKNIYIYSSSKQNAIRELLSTSTKSVVFLNSNMEIIHINEQMHKQFSTEKLVNFNFLSFSKKYRLNNVYHFAEDINESIKTMLVSKLSLKIIQNERSITWRVEYFPELFETDFKIGLIEITDNIIKSEQDPFCQSVFERVNNIIQNTPDKSILNSVLYNIIQVLPGRAHIKRASDFSYIMTNSSTLKLLGMKEAKELIGMNDYLVAKHMCSRWPVKLAQELQEIDYAVIHNNSPLISKEETPYLSAEGNLVIHSLTKIPIYDLDNQPFGILTLAIDMTHLKDLIYLKNAYYNLYSKPKESHYHFIKHIGLDKMHADVNDLITIRELECLILFSKGMTAKEIGKHLNISNRTVERHFECVKAKFNCLTRSEAISLFLSNFNFYPPVTKEL